MNSIQHLQKDSLRIIESDRFSTTWTQLRLRESNPNDDIQILIS